MGNWSGFFYWIIHFSAVKEILDYDINISMVCLWDQELLGYYFTVVHRPNIIMLDVDSLSRRYGKLIATHVGVSSVLKDRYL